MSVVACFLPSLLVARCHRNQLVIARKIKLDLYPIASYIEHWIRIGMVSVTITARDRTLPNTDPGISEAY